MKMIRDEGGAWTRSNKIVWSVLALIPIGLALTMATNYVTKQEMMTGVVEDVRITSVIKQTSSGGGNAVSGAIVGGLLFDTAGAIIGAAAGDGPSRTVVQENIVAAKFVAKLSDGTVVSFNFGQFSDGINECALLRKGDKVGIIKTSKKRTGIEYAWNRRSFF